MVSFYMETTLAEVCSLHCRHWDAPPTAMLAHTHSHTLTHTPLTHMPHLHSHHYTLMLSYLFTHAFTLIHIPYYTLTHPLHTQPSRATLNTPCSCAHALTHHLHTHALTHTLTHISHTLNADDRAMPKRTSSGGHGRGGAVTGLQGQGRGEKGRGNRRGTEIWRCYAVGLKT